MDKHPFQSTPARKYCVVRSAAESYAIAADAIREITMVPPSILVPGCQPIMVAMGHLRNEFLPIVSLAQLLRAGHRWAKEVDESQMSFVVQQWESTMRMLVIQGECCRWGILIEGVPTLQSLELCMTSEFSLPHSALSSNEPTQNTSNQPVIATASQDGEIVRVLDTHRLYRRAEEILRRAWEQWDSNHLTGRKQSEVLTCVS
jgi:chemotaxis signal transduction protein